MGLKKDIKKKAVAKSKSSKDLAKKTLKGLAVVGENDTPFLKQEANGDMSIYGDPNKIDEPDNAMEYTVQLILPKETFNIEEFESVKQDGKDNFLIELIATQEPIRPNNRTYLSIVALEFIQLFFVGNDEGELELIKDEKHLKRNTLEFFKDEMLVDSAKFFIGKFLGIDDELVPYINEYGISMIVMDLIIANPTIFNEMYFKLK